ncbi:hypothetical protein D3C80_1579890 [compost metagenome]
MRDAQLSQMIYAQRVTGCIPQTGFGKSLELALMHHSGALVRREITYMQLIDNSISRMREPRRLVTLPACRISLPQVYNS